MICVNPKVRVWSYPLQLIETAVVTTHVNAAPEIGEDCHKSGVKRLLINQHTMI